MLDHRGQLEHVTDEDDLLATKGLSRAQHLAHCVIDGINDVASNHRDLIDDDGVGMAQREDFGLVHLPAGARHTNLQRQAEEGMNRFAPRKDGSHAGWSKNDKVLVHHLLHIVQKGGLTSTSSSCEEKARVGVGDEFVGTYLLGVLGVDGSFFHVSCCFLSLLFWFIVCVFSLWLEFGY